MTLPCLFSDPPISPMPYHDPPVFFNFSQSFYIWNLFFAMNSRKANVCLSLFTFLIFQLISAKCCVSCRNRSFFFCRPKQMIGFYMKCNSGPKWVNNLTLLWRNERVNNFQTYCATSTFRDKHFILVTQANYYLYLIIIYPHPLVFHLVFPLVV